MEHYLTPVLAGHYTIITKTSKKCWKRSNDISHHRNQIMNYIKHLTAFYEKVAQDNTLNPSHISLYLALFQFWNFSRFRNPVSISRDEVMRISKIRSKATYHKCLKNLHSSGYIDYQPSYNPFQGSQVVMLDFGGELKLDTKRSSK